MSIVRGSDPAKRLLLSQSVAAKRGQGPGGEPIVVNEAAHRRLAFLARASDILSSSLDYEGTLESVAGLAVPVLADWCFIDLVDLVAPDEQINRIAVAYADAAGASEATRAWNAELCREFRAFPPAHGKPDGVRKALRTGLSELISDLPDGYLELATQDARHLELARSLAVRSLMFVPLQGHDRTLGVITFAVTASGRRYGAEDLVLAEELAGRAALAIDHAQLYRQAREALRVRDDFLSSISHELRTPLTSIRAYTQLVRRRAQRLECTEAQQIVEMLGNMEVASSRMEAMIKELLDLTRLQSGRSLELRRQLTELVALVRACAVQHQQGTTRHEITVHASDPELTGMWDSDRLERTISNLIANAVKYSSGGTITITVARQETAAGLVAVCTVRDEGIGIPTDELPFIFDRFRRGANVNVAEQTWGCGIGLAVARQIVQQHGGTIAVSSEEGDGTTFTVTLPLV